MIKWWQWSNFLHYSYLININCCCIYIFGILEWTFIFLLFVFWDAPFISYAWINLLLQAGTVSSFSKLTVQDLRNLIPPEFYPSWVSFTQRQKLSFCLCLPPVDNHYVVKYCLYWYISLNLYSLNGWIMNW